MSCFLSDADLNSSSGLCSNGIRVDLIKRQKESRAIGGGEFVFPPGMRLVGQRPVVWLVNEQELPLLRTCRRYGGEL